MRIRIRLLATIFISACTAFGQLGAQVPAQEQPGQKPEKPGIGQVLVGIEFSPINFSDILVAQGLYALRPELPSVIGNEGVGRVLEIGDKVVDLRVGDRVVLPIGRFVWRQRLVVALATAAGPTT